MAKHVGPSSPVDTQRWEWEMHPANYGPRVAKWASIRAVIQALNLSNVTIR